MGIVKTSVSVTTTYELSSWLPGVEPPNGEPVDRVEDTFGELAEGSDGTIDSEQEVKDGQPPAIFVMVGPGVAVIGSGRAGLGTGPGPKKGVVPEPETVLPEDEVEPGSPKGVTVTVVAATVAVLVMPICRRKPTAGLVMVRS